MYIVVYMYGSLDVYMYKDIYIELFRYICVYKYNDIEVWILIYGGLYSFCLLCVNLYIIAPLMPESLSVWISYIISG